MCRRMVTIDVALEYLTERLQLPEGVRVLRVLPSSMGSGGDITMVLEGDGLPKRFELDAPSFRPKKVRPLVTQQGEMLEWDWRNGE